jgi:hypothetical protein
VNARFQVSEENLKFATGSTAAFVGIIFRPLVVW